MLTTRYPKAPLANLPTPLHELSRLSEYLRGPRIFIKRDDQTGLGLGGNKTRKLEYLLGDALALNCDAVITAGAVQSNHCRQTAAACAALGLECHLVLGGEPSGAPQGNLLLDQLFAATCHYTGLQRRGERMDELVQQLREAGRKPYLVPYGGSNELGALAYVDALLELESQSSLEFSHIVIASSSGGTQAGLVVGKRWLGLQTCILGIDIDKRTTQEPAFDQQILDIARRTTKLLDDRADAAGPTLPELDDVKLNTDYLGGGYAVVGDAELEAIALLAKLEGILLDPVYTGRAMAGLIDMIRQGRFAEAQNVLFWHTGGAPALFAWNQPIADWLKTANID